MKLSSNLGLTDHMDDYDWEYHSGQEGRHDVQRWKTLVGGRGSTTKGLTYGICELPPEAIQWPHYHAEHEIYFVYQGESKVLLGEEILPVEKGSVLYIPGNLQHGVLNDTNSTFAFEWIFPSDNWSTVKYHMLDKSLLYPPD